jgi:hypothetical protein
MLKIDHYILRQLQRLPRSAHMALCQRTSKNLISQDQRGHYVHIENARRPQRRNRQVNAG